MDYNLLIKRLRAHKIKIILTAVSAETGATHTI